VALVALVAVPLAGRAVDYVDRQGLRGVAERVWVGTPRK
jgi:hypothetical protein